MKNITCIEDLRQIVDTLTQQNRRPTMLVVDWVQAAVMNHMAARNIGDEQLTMQLDRFAKGFAQLCRPCPACSAGRPSILSFINCC